MPVRLSVIMVHTASPNRVSGWTADTLVGELIGLPGIDLSLVAPFANLAESSTDRLQLESINTDVAVLDWQSPAQTIDALRSIGFVGWRAAHQHDPDVPAPPASQRRIYAIDLTRFSRTEDVLTALDRLRADREVRTFTLGPMLPISLSSDSQAKSPRSQANKPPPQMKQEPAGSAPAVGPAEDQEPATAARSAPVEDRPALDLDHLLDQLDQLDP